MAPTSLAGPPAGTHARITGFARSDLGGPRLSFDDLLGRVVLSAPDGVASLGGVLFTFEPSPPQLSGPTRPRRTSCLAGAKYCWRITDTSPQLLGDRQKASFKHIWESRVSRVRNDVPEYGKSEVLYEALSKSKELEVELVFCFATIVIRTTDDQGTHTGGTTV